MTSVRSENYMGSEATYLHNYNLLACPFMESCKLPKIKFLCKIPACKTCPDYNSKVKGLKSRVPY